MRLDDEGDDGDVNLHNDERDAREFKRREAT